MIFYDYKSSGASLERSENRNSRHIVCRLFYFFLSFVVNDQPLKWVFFYTAYAKLMFAG